MGPVAPLWRSGGSGGANDPNEASGRLSTASDASGIDLTQLVDLTQLEMLFGQADEATADMLEDPEMPEGSALPMSDTEGEDDDEYNEYDVAVAADPAPATRMSEGSELAVSPADELMLDNSDRLSSWIKELEEQTDAIGARDPRSSGRSSGREAADSDSSAGRAERAERWGGGARGAAGAATGGATGGAAGGGSSGGAARPLAPPTNAPHLAMQVALVEL